MKATTELPPEPLKTARRELGGTTVSYVMAIATFALFALFVVARQRQPFDLTTIEPYRNAIAAGFGRTIWVSLVALVASTTLGFIFYLLSTARVGYFRAFTDVFTEIIYGTPLLVMIMITAFVIGPAFGSTNRAAMGFLGLIVYITPYMTNIFRSAISSISSEQYMAMDLFGFTPFQRYRYIIVPQVVRILMPPLMNNFSLIIKGSALLNVLSYRELFYEVSLMTNNTFRFVEGFLLMWGLYLVITIPLSQLTKWIDRRWGI
ncbi:MAG: amino acid ABC transporter permease [Spirochaetaceae bacterium]|nr:MAG: amino acid ABC transporter permease [Spirochaetaceae bacterium]